MPVAMRGAHAALSPNFGDPARPVAWHTWHVSSYTALPSWALDALGVFVVAAVPDVAAAALAAGGGADAVLATVAVVVAGGAVDAGAADAVCVAGEGEDAGSFHPAPAWSAR